jgi:type IV pilus assembly protein PilE
MDVRAIALPGLVLPPVCAPLPFVRQPPLTTSKFRDPAVMKRAKGFTLIELMIAVAIVAILATIAVSSYQFAVRKGNRGDAQAFMLDVAQREQQIFLDSRSYVAVANNAAFGPDIGIPVPTRLDGLYDFQVQLVDIAGNGPPPPVFRIVAVAKGSQLQDGNLMMDNMGNKTPTDKW